MVKFYSIEGNNLILRIHLQPGAKTNEVVGVHDDWLKIKIKAPASEGKANAALIKFLVDQFDVTRQEVMLTQGKQSRYKQVVINNLGELPLWFLNIVE